MITVIFRLTAKNSEEFLQHLAQVLPTTRAYQGCHSVNTFVQADLAHQIMLVLSWDSRKVQEEYIQWRKRTGDLEKFLSFLASPPVVEYWDSHTA